MSTNTNRKRKPTTNKPSQTRKLIEKEPVSPPPPAHRQKSTTADSDSDSDDSSTRPDTQQHRSAPKKGGKRAVARVQSQVLLITLFFLFTTFAHHIAE